ncbi:ABC transporter permease [Devosia sp. MC521]|uniref:ABC transporter permease n=1 Tax=Devosia sp. MC521 TaxID=2759954 RepID=UPI0015F80B8D|nr:ABC transporter permease [Devosia sp. MC521]MBJ6988023.1 ABC transporter permease [Devosia sp. MC521]QMW62095.1 ABC transporter permease [Devosia sp. MC521]
MTPTSVTPEKTTKTIRLPRLPFSLWIAIIMLAGVLALMALVPLWSGFDPNKQSLFFALEPAFTNPAHPLGTDALGRDILSRLSVAASVSVLVALGAVCISAVIGIVIGLLAGWMRGPVDSLLMALGNVQLAIPTVLLLIVLVAALGSSPLLLVILLGCVNWVGYGRVVRAQVISLREREFITAVTTAGGSSWWIMRKHLLPNVLPAVLVLAAFDVGVIITVESSLSFIGLGIQPPTPSLGLMISEGQRYLQTNLPLTLLPALVIFFLIGGIQFASQSLNRAPSRG